MICRKCDIEMVERQAIVQTETPGLPDFPGSYIITPPASGPGRLIPCWKCPNCGRSLSR